MTSAKSLTGAVSAGSDCARAESSRRTSRTNARRAPVAFADARRSCMPAAGGSGVIASVPAVHERPEPLGRRRGSPAAAARVARWLRRSRRAPARRGPAHPAGPRDARPRSSGVVVPRAGAVQPRDVGEQRAQRRRRSATSAASRSSWSAAPTQPWRRWIRWPLACDLARAPQVSRGGSTSSNGGAPAMTTWRSMHRLVLERKRVERSPELLRRQEQRRVEAARGASVSTSAPNASRSPGRSTSTNATLDAGPVATSATKRSPSTRARSAASRANARRAAGSSDEAVGHAAILSSCRIGRASDIGGRVRR